MDRLYPLRILLAFSIFILSVGGQVLLDDEIDGKEFTDEGMSVILYKLNKIQEKIDTIENQLNVMTNKEDVNVQQLVAQTVKEYEMQRTLERINQKVEDLTISQQELKAGMIALTKNLEESVTRQQNLQQIDFKNLEINTTSIKSLFEFYKDKIVSKISAIENGILTIATESRNIRDSQEKWTTKIENYIAKENLKVIDHYKKNTEEIIKRLETVQKDIPIQIQTTGKDQMSNERVLERFEKTLKDISTSMQENFKNLLRNQIEIKQDSRENHVRIRSQLSIIENEIRKNRINNANGISQTVLKDSTGLARADLYVRSELTSLGNTIKGLNNTVNNIADYLLPPFDNCTTAVKTTSLAGVHKIYIPHTSFGAFDAYCMTDSKNGSGWTVIQKRYDGSVSFNQNWKAYKKGFGSVSGEHWLGLEKIHALTSRRPHMLWIELEDFQGNVRHARYAMFEIGNEKERYYLKKVGAYNGDAGDSFGNASPKRKFTTYDLDNDDDSTRNCAARFLGAWWYDTCNWSGLNGEYNNTANGKGLNWSKWLGYEYSLKRTTMAIRVVE